MALAEAEARADAETAADLEPIVLPMHRLGARERLGAGAVALLVVALGIGAVTDREAPTPTISNPVTLKAAAPKSAEPKPVAAAKRHATERAGQQARR